MGRRALIELAFIVAGLAMALVLTHAAAWAYPLGREAIWWSGLAAMVATIGMGIGPLRRAMRQDRGA